MLSSHDPKPIWQSKSVLAGATVIVGANLPILLPWLGITDPQTITGIMQLVCGQAGVLALVGRLTAKRALR